MPALHKIILVLIISFGTKTIQAQNVGVNDNNSSPDASAMFHIQSTNKGLLIPRMNTLQRNAISNAADGLLVFDINRGEFAYFDNFLEEWFFLSNGRQLIDKDQDTRVRVEFTADEDRIRFQTAGTEYWFMDGPALQNLNSGNSVFIGNGAGASEDLSLRSNTFIGQSAGQSTSSGSFNVFLGHEAGRDINGSDNTFLGQQSGIGHSSGSANVYIGRRAAFVQGSGSNNTYVGTFAASNKSGGSENTIIGFDAGTNNGSGSGNIFLGNRAGAFESGSNKLYIHNSSSNTPLIYGDFSSSLLRINGRLDINNAYQLPIADGNNGQVLQTDGNGAVSWADARGTSLADQDSDTRVEVEEGNDVDEIRFYVQNELEAYFDRFRLNMTSIRIGNNAGNNGTDNSSIYIGSGAGDGLSNTTEGQGNTVIGAFADLFNDAENATAIGANSFASASSTAIGVSASSAEQGVAVGNFARAETFATSIGLSAGGTGVSNTAIGYNALDVVQGSNNVAVGSSTMPATLGGSNNVAVGAGALFTNVAGSENVAIGTNALSAGVANANNVAIGQEAMNSANGASQCTTIGFESDLNSPDLVNSMALGASSRVSADNRVVVGNSSVGSIGGFEDWTNFSDGRFKTNLQEDVPGLDFIQGLRPITYNLDVQGIRKELRTEDSYLNPEKAQTRYSGFIAQEVEALAMDLGYAFSGVDTPGHDDDFYGLRYATFVVPLVVAVQEQQEVIEDLASQLSMQQQQIDQQAAILSDLEARLAQLENQ
ncbi:MAG: tail fiber domain-containing protein [Bacteroidota bacterium]